jgi:hypothetical protein
MGRNRDLRRRISALQRRLAEHETKIRRQWAADFPDEGLIAHWRQEIAAWEQELARLTRRLERKW